MTKQVHKYSLQDTITGNITEQTDMLSVQVDEELLLRIKTFLINKNNLLGLDIDTCGNC
jgi:hypothetical protein